MRSQTNNILKTLAIFTVLSLIIINSRLIPSPLRTKLLDMSGPALKSLSSTSDSLSRLAPFSALRRENAALRERIDILNRQISEMNLMREENQRLRELLDFKKVSPYAVIPAQVIGRDPSNWSNTIIIDKGSAAGVRQGKAVVSAKGLVGRIVETGRYSSRILLISDVNSRVGVLIVRNRQGGILIGSPNGNCKMIYIEPESDVAGGDTVITAGFGSVFPKDIMVGRVVSVNKEPGRLYKSAIVKPLEDLSKLESVLCIK